MKTMQTAFEQDHSQPPEPRAPQLRKIMRESVLKAKGHGVRSIDDFLSVLYDHDDALPLVWELFASVRGGVLQQLFSSVIDELRLEGAAMPRDGGEANAASPRGQRDHAKPSSRSRTGWQERRDSHRAFWKGRLADDINGKPLGDCTAGQVRTHARNLDSLVGRYQRYSRFLLMVVQSIPDDSFKVGDFHNAESVDHLFDLAAAAAADPKEKHSAD
jgi:hypothetical protein